MHIWSESQRPMSDTKWRRGADLVPLEPKPETQPHSSRYFGCLLSISGLCCPESEEGKITVTDLEVEAGLMDKHWFDSILIGSILKSIS